MKINDKVIAAFLVSLGLFSTGQATQYVNSLSSKEKQTLYLAAETSTETSQELPPRTVTQQEND